MCLIAYVPSGHCLSREVFDKANQTNPHGIGVMSEKGVEKFYGNKQLKRARNYVAGLAAEKIAHAVHWRYATHGSRGLALCHPFKLPNANVWLMHNGVIGSTAKDADEDASDTLLYVNKLTDAPGEYPSDLSYWNKVCDDIGSHNKGLVMYPNGKFVILNQDHGHMIENIWYSNSYSLPVAMRPATNYFMPARLRPASQWNYGTGNWMSNHGGRSFYETGTPYTNWGGPFGSMIYWSDRFKAYGFWTGQKFQCLNVTEGQVYDTAITPDPKPLPTLPGKLEPTDDKDKKCPRCLRYKKDPPIHHLLCWCSDQMKAEWAATHPEKPAMPSGPTLETSETANEKAGLGPSGEACEHGEGNWENCRECIAQLEQDASSGVQEWLRNRSGQNWRLRTSDPQVRADELAQKVIYLPRASEK